MQFGKKSFQKRHAFFLTVARMGGWAIARVDG
jgi:hypothetical protein